MWYLVVAVLTTGWACGWEGVGERYYQSENFLVPYINAPMVPSLVDSLLFLFLEPTPLLSIPPHSLRCLRAWTGRTALSLTPAFSLASMPLSLFALTVRVILLMSA